MKTKIALGSLATVLSVGAVAVESTSTTYVAGHQDSVSSLSWEEAPDFDFPELVELYPEMLPIEIQELFTEQGRVLFNVRWTFESIHSMFTEVWETYPNTDTEIGRQEALYDIRNNVACRPDFKTEDASVYGLDIVGDVLNLEAASCVEGDSPKPYRVRSYIPTTPGATYTFEFVYRQLKEESTDDDTGYHHKKFKKLKKHHYGFKSYPFAFGYGQERDDDDDDDHQHHYKSGYLNDLFKNAYKWKKKWFQKFHKHPYGHSCEKDKHHKHHYFHKFHHHHHDCGDDVDEKEAPTLSVKIGDQLTYLPTIESSDDVIEEGFIVKTLTFTASKFYTPITVNKDGVNETNPLLIRSFEVNEIISNPRKDICAEIYPNKEYAQTYCLLGEKEPEFHGCDLEQGQIVWKQGTSDSNHLNANMSTESNLLSTDADTYLALGQSGNAVLRIREEGYIASCLVEGKTLSIQEVNETALNEVGLVKVRFKRCDNEMLNGGFTLLTNDLNSGANTFTSNQGFSFTFAEGFEGCAVDTIKFEDGLGIYWSGAVDPYDGDGVDINSLTLQ